MRADAFADIPAVGMFEIKRQKPRNAVRMSENALCRLILP